VEHYGMLPTWLMPAFLAFGPLFAVTAPNRIYAMAGAIMLAFALLTLFVRTMQLEKEVARLQGSR
jgi:hypothetical protein